MLNCEICNKSVSSLAGLSCHVVRIHKITKKEYYDKYLKKDSNEGFCKNCKKPSRFLGLQGYTNYCDNKCSNSHSEVKNKKIATWLVTLGVPNPAQSEKVQEKMGDTNFKNLGVRIPAKTKKVVDKMKSTLIERVGVDNAMKYKPYVEKNCESTFRHFGVRWSMQSPIVREKSAQTIFKKYGVYHISHTLKEQERKRNQIPWNLGISPDEETLIKISDGLIIYNREHPENAEAQRQRMKNGLAAYMNRFIKNPSVPGVKLKNLVLELYPEADPEHPVFNYSIDVAIPEYKIAIEYDGYFHFNSPEAIEYYKNRQEKIEGEGWKFIKYTMFDKFPSKEQIELDILKVLKIFIY